MGIFDIVVMLVGGLLIVCGLVLFVSGKRESGKNNVEAFGIKVDVSNPSILLIAFGVILLLVPRLLPASKHTKPLAAVDNEIEEQLVSREDRFKKPFDENPQLDEPIEPERAQAPSLGPETVPSLDAEQASMPTSGVLPTGTFELTSYQANGVYAPAVEGAMVMQALDNTSFGWTTQLGGFDDFGQMVVYQYTGYIQNRSGGWIMMITASSDPGYLNQGEFPVRLNYSEDELTMHYQYMGAPMVLAWEKID